MSAGHALVGLRGANTVAWALQPEAPHAAVAGMRRHHLWLGDKDTAVWHHAAVRLEQLVYRTVCGAVTDARQCLFWPQKAGDVGQPLNHRCFIGVAVVTGRPHGAAIEQTVLRR